MKPLKTRRRDLHREAAEEVQHCRADFLYFCENYLFYEDRYSRHVNFVPNEEQLLLLHSMETQRQVLNLKARKLGMSTLLCFYALWLALFHRTKCALLAHDDASVKNLVRTKFRYAITHLPSFLKAGDFKIREDNIETGLVFVGGGSLRVSQNEGAAFRGGDIGFLHISEFAFLADPAKTFAAALNACLPGSIKVIETTAKGLGKMHELWYGEGTAWSKLFFPWMTSPMYSISDGRTSVAAELDAIRTPENITKVGEYVSKYRLSVPQTLWLLHKLSENGFDWVGFHREYPATPALAFSTAKGRVFNISFNVGKPREGFLAFEPVRFGEATSMGVDTAYGYEDGDFHALAVMAGTREKPRLLATGYDHMPLHSWCSEVRTRAIEFNSMIVGDPGGNGAAVLDDLRGNGYPNIYRRKVVDRIGSQAVEKLGYAFTDATRTVLVRHLMVLFGGDKPLMPLPKCQRLCHEINEFKYNEEHKDNRPEHGPGAHDDLLFAVAMAYHGLDLEIMSQHIMAVRRRPKTDGEELLYEVRTGKAYNELDDFDDDDEATRKRVAEARRREAKMNGDDNFLLPQFGGSGPRH